jgi:hypothetical protein
LTVTFQCNASDPDGDGISNYWWSFGDGDEAGPTQQPTITHTYSQAGTYLAVCYARDGRSSPAANLKFEYVTVFGSVAPVCEDGTCNGGEDCKTCPADCGNCCGDGTCTADHDEDCKTCPADCGDCCGDGTCTADHDENCQTCPADCGDCCGDGTCTADHDEDCKTCPADCSTPDGEVCCGGTLFDGDCCTSQDCISPDTCQDHVCTEPQPSCGDETCNDGEDCRSCPADCGECCGDETCTADHDEDCQTCPADCPTPDEKVCCGGTLFDGDCCDDDDCASPGTCVGHICLLPSTCETDADGDHYGLGDGCAGADCDDQDPSVHPGAEERCNYRDDDCDGHIDEEWPALGDACSAGVGACSNTGRLLCKADGSEAICDAVAGSPIAEDCDDGQDNDCDGLVDGADDDCKERGPRLTEGCSAGLSSAEAARPSWLGLLVAALGLSLLMRRRRPGRNG